jgi:hypothetical protein
VTARYGLAPPGGGATTTNQEIDMMVIWTFENGRLTASDDAGKVLREWAAEDALGRGLAVLFNQAQSLSQMLVAG